MDTSIDLTYDRRSYFGMSDTNLQIYGEETRWVVYDKVLD